MSDDARPETDDTGDTRRDQNGNFTLEDFNNYISELKQWIENTRRTQQQLFTPAYNSNWEESVYQNSGYTFQVIPPLWKRLIAEAIDFIILFALKLYLTFVILSNLEIPIPDTDHFISVFDHPKKIMEMYTELALLEFLYRAVACVYETYWLHGAEAATPGKLFMGLRVIYVVDVLDVNNQTDNHVRVHPGTRLGWKRSFYRAVLKNVFMAFMIFPLCFAFLLFKHNRTGYDLMVKTLVIQHRPLGNIPQNIHLHLH